MYPKQTDKLLEFDSSRDYYYLDELIGQSGAGSSSSSAAGKGKAKAAEDQGAEGTQDKPLPPPDAAQFVLLQFEKSVQCPKHALIIGSNLQTDIRK